MNYSTLIGGAAAASALNQGIWIGASRAVTVPAWARRAFLVLHGAGGGGAVGGAASNSTTGGNSAPWGVKQVEVQSGDVITFTLGAGGVGRNAGAGNNNGNPGSSSTVALNAATVLTMPGGEGGIFATSGLIAAPTPTATPTGADFWLPGLPAWSASGAAAGGAAANLLGMLASELVTTPNTSGRGVGSRDSNTPMLGYLHNWLPLSLIGTGALQPGVGGLASSPGGLCAGGGASSGAGGQGGGGGGGLSNTSGTSGPGGAALGYLILLES